MLLVGLLLALTVSTVFAMTLSPLKWYDNFKGMNEKCSEKNNTFIHNKIFECGIKENFSDLRSYKVSHESLGRKKGKPNKGGGGGGGGFGGLAAAAAAPALAAAAGGLGPALAASLLRIPAILVSVAVPLGTALMSGQAVLMAQVALVIAVIVGLQLALNGNNKHDHKDSVVKHVFLKQGNMEKLHLQSNIVFPSKLRRIYL